MRVVYSPRYRIDIGTHVFPTQKYQLVYAALLDHGVIGLATSLAGSGVRVIVAGTDTDFRGEPFGPMGDLMAIGELVDKLHAICVICGNPASRNQRLIGGRPARYDSPTIMVGGSESYEARCRRCFDPTLAGQPESTVTNKSE